MFFSQQVVRPKLLFGEQQFQCRLYHKTCYFFTSKYANMSGSWAPP